MRLGATKKFAVSKTKREPLKERSYVKTTKPLPVRIKRSVEKFQKFGSDLLVILHSLTTRTAACKKNNKKDAKSSGAAM